MLKGIEIMEKYRPQIHYSPEKGWINDPNGLVFDGSRYHLFCQKNPDAKHWGPMHWGHAVSDDLLHWQEQPIALRPDEDGMAFSGSAVIDRENVSGLGKDCLIALYTNHNAEKEEESQYIAYSSDYVNFKKYEGNPVISDECFKDFRDPKFFYDKHHNSYHAVLAAGDRVCFYSTKDFLKYEKTGEFSSEVDLGGVWECPDMISFDTEAGTIWVLIVSRGATPGEKGSQTGYFVGTFDGSTFKAFESDVFKLLDDGPDDYAIVSFGGVNDRILSIGWMINWNYPFTERDMPTDPFCGSMTLPRELVLHNISGSYYLSSLPCRETIKHFVESSNDSELKSECFGFSTICHGDVDIILSNDLGEKFCFGVKGDSIYADRSGTDCSCFNDFASHCEVKRKMSVGCMLKMIFDTSSAEIFADDGLTDITMNMFPTKPFTKIECRDNCEPHIFYPKD